MSSSSRSRRTSQSSHASISKSSQPRWQKSLTTARKPQPATSVSRIFAQPLQGSPLRSAIDNLPSVSIDDSASSLNETSGKRERALSVLGDEGDSQDTLAEGQTDVTRRKSKVASIMEVQEPETISKDAHVLSQAGTVYAEPLSTSVASQGTLALVDNKEVTSVLSHPAAVQPPASLSESEERVATSAVSPTSEPNSQPPKSHSSPKKSGRSWFGSISRVTTRSSSSSASSNKTRAASESTTELGSGDQGAREGHPHPQSSGITSPPTPIPLPAATPQPIRPTPPRRSSLYSTNRSPKATSPLTKRSLPSSPARPSLLSKPPINRQDSDASLPDTPTSILTPDSVDSQVPELRYLRSPMPTPAAMVERFTHPQENDEGNNAKVKRQDSVSSTPASGSGFMLRIPFLGRAKTPLPIERPATDVSGSGGTKGEGTTGISDVKTEVPGGADIHNTSLTNGSDLKEGVETLRTEGTLLSAQVSVTSSPEELSQISAASGTPASGGVSALAPSTDASQSVPTMENEASEPTQGENTEEASISLAPEAPPASSSWLGFLGWGGPTATPTAVATPEVAVEEVKEAEVPSQQATDANDAQVKVAKDNLATLSPPRIEIQRSTGTEFSDFSLVSFVSAESHFQQDSKTSEVDGLKKPASVLSSGTAASSAWYYPWSWFAGSATVPSQSATSLLSEQSKDTNGEGNEQGNGGHVKTASEMVKEEALARDEADAKNLESSSIPIKELETDPETPTPQTTSSSPTNPIESTIESNKQGWASFFLGRALITKGITDGSSSTNDVKRDENGVEIMDIESDEEGEQHGKENEGAKPDAKDKGLVISVAGKETVRPKGLSVTPSPASSSLPSEPAKPPPSPVSPPSTQEREPKKSGPPAPPLTNSESIKEKTTNPSGNENSGKSRQPSPTPSSKSKISKSGTSTPITPKPPNLVLPTWADTFHTSPRAIVQPRPSSPKEEPPTFPTIAGALSYVSGLLGGEGAVTDKGKGKADEEELERERMIEERERKRAEEWAIHGEFVKFGKDLPKALDVLANMEGGGFDPKEADRRCRVVVIGVSGWSPGAVTRTLAGGLPSSSTKFVDMTCAALEAFEEEHSFRFKKITKIPLDADGTIERKTSKVHSHLLGNIDWLEDLHLADVIFVAAHSQGTIIATHLIDRLIREGHILTPRNVDILNNAAAAVGAVAPGGMLDIPEGIISETTAASQAKTQKICCLALCGIHLGPLRYLRTSSLLQPYIQYFENASARELFEFQSTETQVSENYVKALRTVMDHGTKMVYVASLNDQVVPVYSGLFTAASHPRILRALYIDGDAYHSSDFLSNLLVLLIRIMNAGFSDSGLLTHLSEATAGTLSGVGHSTAYEELATYSLAVNYLFLTNDGTDVRTDLVVQPFNAVDEQNDYEIPWSLRDLIADDAVAHFFAHEFAQLRDAFDDWVPKTSILRDIKRKLAPIQRLSRIKTNETAGNNPPNSRL